MPPLQCSTLLSLQIVPEGGPPLVLVAVSSPSPSFALPLQAIVDHPEIFTSLGFTGGPGISLRDPCLIVDFIVDSQAEIMGTQVSSETFCCHPPTTRFAHVCRTPSLLYAKYIIYN